MKSVLSRAYKLRVRRRLRLQKRQVEGLGAQAEQHLERNFFKRLERLVIVRRFVLSWVVLVLLLTGCVVAQLRALSGYYQVFQPVPGGTYREGILGSFTNANPVYATGLVDGSIAKLVFAGLLKYDQQNRLVGDLAESWQSDELGANYTVKLKPDLTWHDGEPLTAEDVVFTYEVIQSPDARSPLNVSWRGVEVSAPDERTIQFKLPNPLASFPYSLTNGIIPEHILGDVPMADMRSSAFNTTEPIGAGPFVWQAIQVDGNSAEDRQEQIALQPFEDYYAGPPALNGFTIRTFRTPEQLIRSFEQQEISAIAGLGEVPEEFAGNPNVRARNLLLTAQVMSFFRNTQDVFKDKQVRKALTHAIDTKSIIESLSYPTVPVHEPLLRGQLGYDPAFAQDAYNPESARQILGQQGWQPGDDGIRRKDNKPLTFNLHTQNSDEYSHVARQLQSQWEEVGANVQLVLQDAEALQNTLAFHSYDALLYGISIGPDPDVFAYWHSSQSDPRAAARLNFSEYDSEAADAALEAGRTRSDRALRAAKYQPFLKAWQADAPALGLYQPRFLYITRGKVHGLNDHPINTDAQRFSNVHNWMIREVRETPEFE